MLTSPDLADCLAGKLSVVESAIRILTQRFANEHERTRRGPLIVDSHIVTEEPTLDGHVDFLLFIKEDCVERICKLRFRMGNERNNTIERQRGRRDLTLLIVPLWLRDKINQILARIYHRVQLVVADIRRQIASWRADNGASELPDNHGRSWRRKRRRAQYKPRFFPPHTEARAHFAAA